MVIALRSQEGNHGMALKQAGSVRFSYTSRVQEAAVTGAGAAYGIIE